MPTRQDTQGDFGLRPTKVTQGITDVYHAPSIPAPDTSALKALSGLSKTAAALIQEHRNTQAAQAKGGEAFGEANPDAQLQPTENISVFGVETPFTRGTTEAAMAGFQKGRGTALKARFKTELEANWAVAQEDDEELLYDTEAYGSFHASQMDAFVKKNGIEGIALATFGLGMDNYAVEKIGINQAKAVANIKTKYLEDGTDSVLSNLAGLERAVLGVDMTTNAEVESIWISEGGVDVNGVPIRAAGQGSVGMVDERQAMKNRAALAHVGELQEFINAAYTIGPDTFAAAVDTVTDQLITEISEGMNPESAILMLDSLKTGEHPLSSRPSVRSALREKGDAINANIARASMTIEDRLRVWEAAEFLDPSTTPAQMRELQSIIANHPYLTPEVRLSLAKKVRSNYEALAAKRTGQARLSSTVSMFMGGTMSGTSQVLAEHSGVGVAVFQGAVEGAIFAEGLAGGSKYGDPEVMQSRIAELGVEAMPNLKMRLKNAAARLSSAGSTLPEEEMNFLLQSWEAAVSEKYNTIGIYGLTDQENDTFRLLSSRITTGGMTMPVAQENIPLNVSFDKSETPEPDQVRTAIENNFDGFGWWSNAGDVDGDRISHNVITGVTALVETYQYDHQGVDLEDSMDAVIGAMKTNGIQGLDGHLIQLKDSNDPTSKSARLARDIDEVRNEVMLQEFRALEADDRRYDELTEKARLAVPMSELSQTHGVDFSKLTREAVRRLLPADIPLGAALSNGFAASVAIAGLFKRLTPQALPGLPKGASLDNKTFRAIIEEAMERGSWEAIEAARYDAAFTFFEEKGYQPRSLVLGEIEKWEDMPVSISSTISLGGDSPNYFLSDSDGNRITWGDKTSTMLSADGLWDAYGESWAVRKLNTSEDRHKHNRQRASAVLRAIQDADSP